jgi:hypothetical protein
MVTASLTSSLWNRQPARKDSDAGTNENHLALSLVCRGMIELMIGLITDYMSHAVDSLFS